ncbi:sulfur carrier protein ThiS [Fulvivirgaceae bacterium BMA10]|uniref:Sulfur carrier protein ThiS n=1 Tax=Splendidivirga corallicola TaxID=3051826 RepID=A0ABT8KPJ0_9BACT|nr:sulfur carrier protein ThiS [Fulvivirgaceae bacterium BMA10]
MEVTINGNQYEFQESSSLEQIIQSLSLKSTQGIAVAIDDMVVPKTDWENHIIKDQDKIMIITATQGG